MVDEKKRKQDTYKLVVPLDASGIGDREPGELVKVAARTGDGKIVSASVKLERGGTGRATLGFASAPKALHVAIGPADASDEELMALQTMTLNVTARQWAGKRALELAPVVLPPYHWYWWRRWCRTFVIRGVLRCPDGSPVPGAKVCAYDVDWFWWWSSRQLIACDTTDASGAFAMKFRWCCGWWPWWWWRRRFWRLEPDLIRRIHPELLRDPTLPKLGDPPPRPSLELFERLLAEDGAPANPRSINPRPIDPKLAKLGAANPKLAKSSLAMLDPARLPGLRERLLGRLPRIPDLDRLKIWPWWPWLPWWDCHPDIVFEATQLQDGEEKVVLEETIWDTRWNIPTLLDVSLVSNDEAFCTGQSDDPEGDCLVIDSACDDLVANIGGNPPAAPGVAAATDGFRHPGGGTTWSDRPYAGVVPISGRFGVLADVEYYEFEISDDDGATWDAMPTGAAGNFTRSYWGSKLGTADPADWHPAPFNFNMVEDTGGVDHYVVESRQHFETNNEPATWGSSRFWWSQTMDRLMRWKTAGLFTDGRYRLRLRSWTLTGAKLGTSEILPLCATTDDNGIVLYLDNRTMTGGPTNANGQPCGGDTVHLCTTEPDTDIVSVKILNSDDSLKAEVAPCGEVTVTAGDKLQVDFVAHDPDGHLAKFTLDAHWGEDQKHSLLSLGTLAPLSPSPVGWAPMAAQEGPTYGDAQSQGAVPPIWHGGAVRLTIDPATAAFPISCCYLLRLTAHKRTIFNCDDDQWTHVNRSERSFMIQV